jgi:integrase
MPLTDMAVRNAKPKGGKPYKLSDGGGLYLSIETGGSKLWRVAFRFDGKQKLLSLGAYPAISLADARTGRDQIKALLAKDVDPSAQRKLDRGAARDARACTFDLIADEWLEKRKPLCSAVTHEKLTWLVSLVRPSLGKISVGAVTPADILAAVKPLVAAGKLDTARRCRATLSRVFNYASLHGRCDRDPAAPLARNDEVLPPPTVKHHAAVTDRRDGDSDASADTRFGELLRAIEGYEGSRSVRNALRLLALIAVRPGELRQLQWSWIGAETITFPAGVMKMREAFDLPLSRQAVAILSEQREMTGWGALVFPAVAPQSAAKRPALRSISESTMNTALRRLGFAHDDHVAHGFRSSFSSLANRSGLFQPDVIEAALAHTVGGVRGVIAPPGK